MKEYALFMLGVALFLGSIIIKVDWFYQLPIAFIGGFLIGYISTKILRKK